MSYDPTQGSSDLYFQADLQDNVSPTADQIEQRLKALGASKTEIKMFLTAYDQATPKIKAAQDMVNKLPKQHMINVQTNADQAQKHLQKLRDVAKAPVEIVVKVKDNVDDYIRSFKDKFRRLEFEMQQQVQHMPITAALVGIGSQAAGMAAGPLSSMTGIPLGGLAAGGAAGAAGAGTAFFAESMKLNSQMQQSMMQLTQLLRSPSAASTEYKSVANFSNTTPFNMRDVLATDISLRNQGINPNNPTIGLRGGGNLAAATGTPLSQASGAVSAANLGYFQSLNNITGMNIRQSDFTYGGRESGKTYQQAVQQILQRYTGALQDQTQTFKGLATNIQDAIQQKLVMPAGQSLFNAAGGMEKRIAGTVTSPQWQLMMSRETDKMNEGMTKLFQLVQQGSTYFKNSLEVPLKSVGNSIIQVGTAFGKTFGSTTLQGIKYMSQALSTLLVPLGKMASIKIPILNTNVGGIMGFMKALQMFGISTNTGTKDFFGGLAHLDLSRALTGMREFTSMAAKIGFYLTAKAVLDFKNSTDQLDNSFKSFGKSGSDALDNLKTKFDLLIFKANMLGKSVSQVQGYGAEGLSAVGVNPTADPHGNIAASIALTTGMNAAKMSTFLGSGSSVSRANSAWYKAMNLGNQIYGQHMNASQASSAVTNVDTQIVQASHALANALGVSLPRALQMTVTGLQTFYTELKGAHAVNPAGAGLASALQYQFAHGGETVADYAQFQQGPQGVVSSMLKQAYAPGASTIASALKRGTLNQSWSFLTQHPNAITGAGGLGQLGTVSPTASSKALLEVLGGNAGIASSGAAINRQVRSQFAGMLPGLQLPSFQNPLTAAGYPNLSRSQVLNANPEQQAKQVEAFADAGAKAQVKLQNVNKQITELNNTLQQYAVVQAQASAAQAAFDLKTLPMQEHIQRMQDAMTAFTLNSVNPLQRAMNAVSQAMADYQQKNIVPIQRAQDVWNQTMLMTSNRLDDVSNSLRVAQYNMQLYSQGMLVGENAAQKNIESLNIYSEKLQALQLLNNGLQQDITRKQVHGGFSSTVAPFSGFSLAREQQIASNRAQLAQEQYDTTYGLQHWQLQRAARTIFQKEEMPFSKRLRGTIEAAASQSSGDIATFALQNLQYQQSLKSRVLEEKMYVAQKGTWGLQDKQYALNKQMFGLQQKMSLDSDKVAKAQLNIQRRSEKIQFNTQKINDLVQIAENGPKGAQNKLYQLNALSGALQNLPADINNAEGLLIKNFGNNVKKGYDALADHLPAIAGDMHASSVMLHSIAAVLGAGGHGPGGGGGLYQPHNTSPGLGGGGGVLSKTWNVISGVALSPLSTLITAANAAANLGHQITGSGTIGAIAGVTTGLAAGLFALNAARIAVGQFTGRAVLPGLAHLAENGEGGWRSKFASFLGRRGETAIEGAGGHGMEVVKSLLRPMAYLWTKLAQFGTVTAVSGAVGSVVPGVGHIAGLPLGWMAGEQAEAAVQKRLIGSRLFPVARSVIHGNAFRDIKSIIAETFGGTSDKTKAAYDKMSKVANAMAPDGKTLRTVGIDPSKAGVADGLRDIPSPRIRTTTPSGSSVRGAPDEQAVADDMKTAGSEQKAASNGFRTTVNNLKSKVADVLHKAAETEAGTAIKNTGAAKKAEGAAGILKDGSSTFRELMKTKFGPYLEDFGGKVKEFGKAGAVVLAASEAIHNSGAVFHDAGQILRGAARDFTKVASSIGKTFGEFTTWAKRALHIGTPKVPKDATGVEAGTASEAEKLNKELSEGGDAGGALRKILSKAGDAGAKALRIGGKVFSIAAKGAGALSFLPAAADALKGNFGGAATQAANAGSYFIPGVGEARIAADVYNLITGALGATPNDKASKITGVGGAKYYNPRVAPFANSDAAITVQKQLHKLSLDEQQAYHNLSSKMQQAAQDAAINGPTGLKNYLDNLLQAQQGGHQYLSTDTMNWLRKDGQSLANHLNDVQTAFATHWTSVGGITSSGFSGIGTMSGKYLESLTKQIKDWGKANGLHLTESNISVVPGNLNFGGAQVFNGSTVVISRAHGGLVEADKHRVGMDRGRLVRMAEEGHPEVVIPLAPHRRQRAQQLVAHTAGIIGMANGGFVADAGTNFTFGQEPKIVSALNKLGEYIHQTIYGISGYRSPQHSLAVGGFADDPHTRGQAADIGVGSQLRASAATLSNTILAKFGLWRPFDMSGNNPNEVNHMQLLPALGGPSEGLSAPSTSMKNIGSLVAAIAGGGGGASHLHLKNAPGALKALGIIGPKQVSALRVMAHKVQTHMNQLYGGAGGATPGMLGTGGIAPGSWKKVANELAKKMGWAPSEVAAWQGVEAAEDGSYSLTATNPRSGAYGLAQMLGTPDGVGPAKQKYFTYGGNPNTLVGQLTAMANYIKQTYGTPSAALAHESAFHWYAGGLPRVARDGTMAMLHQGETVLSAAQTNSGAGSQGASESLKVLKEIAGNTSGTNTYLGKQVALQEQEFVSGLRAHGPNGKGTGSLIGAKYNSHLINTAGGSSILGPAATQTSNLVTSLIGSLHNTPVTETIAKAGKAHSYTFDPRTNKLVESKHKVSDAKALVIDEKSLTAINKKIDEVKAAMKHEKKGSKAYEKNLELLKSLEGEAKEMRKHIAAISTTLHMSLAKALETRGADQKQVKVDKEQIGRLEKALKGHNLTAAERKTDEKKLSSAKHNLTGDETELKNLNKALKPALDKWIKMEEKAGVSKKAIDLALKNVGKGDNHGRILSDKQLQAQGKLGEYTGGSKVHGKQLHSGAGTGSHSQRGHKTPKEVKDIAMSSKNMSKTVSKHLLVATKQLGMSGKHFGVANKHLGVANKHLGVSSKHVAIASKHLSASIKNGSTAMKQLGTAFKHLGIGEKHLAVSSAHKAVADKKLQVGMEHKDIANKHLGISTNIDKTTGKHLSVASAHAATAAKHLSLSGSHYDKNEKSADTAAKDRKGAAQDADVAHKDASTFHRTAGSHQTRIEGKFDQMVTHLSRMVGRLDSMNLSVNNNIDVQVAVTNANGSVSVGKGSVRSR